MQALEDQTVGVIVTCCKTFYGKRLFRSREVKKEKVEKIYAKPFRCDFLLLHYLLGVNCLMLRLIFRFLYAEHSAN